jgi:predicted nucleotidyltransferase
LNRLEKVLSDIYSDLRSEEVHCALVGGLAVSVRTEPRFTRDADLAVAVEDDRAAESLVHHLQNRGYTILAIVQQEATGRLATVRLTPPNEPETGVVVDLLFASSGIEAEIVSIAEELDLVEGLAIPVARVGHLIALKVLSRDDEHRPQDLADLRVLLKAASPQQIKLARESLDLVVVRGYNRSRDLISDLDQLLETQSLS